MIPTCIPGNLIIGLFMMGAALTSTGAAWTEREDLATAKKMMNKPVMGLKKTKAKGKEAAFLKALEQHQGIIMKICRAYANNHVDEKDLFQEIVFQLWKGYPTFRNKSNVSTWFYRVAVNTAMWPYKRRRKVDLEYRPVLPDVPGGDVPDERGNHDEFHKLFQQLIPVDRAIVSLMMANFTLKEIGAVVGMSEDGVRMRVKRAGEGLVSGPLVEI